MTYTVEGGNAQPVFVVNPASPASGGGGTVEVAGGQVTANQGTPGVQPWLVAGSDGSPLATNATAQAIVDALVARLPELIGGRLPVGVQFPETQPISAGSLPLPNDAATQTTLAQVLAALGGTLAVAGPLTNEQLRAAPPPVVSPLAYAATAAGGRVAFNITTRVISINAQGEQPLAALVNPANSGEDMVLWVGEFGSSAATTFRRYAGATITTVPANGAPIAPRNTGGGAATSAALMYVGGATPTFTPNFTNAVVAKDAFIRASETYFTRIEGGAILRPGGVIVWTIQGPQSGNFSASVYFEYIKRPAEA